MVRSQTTVTKNIWTCSSCLRAQQRHAAHAARREWRSFGSTRTAHEDEAQKGAMSRRLSEMAEESSQSGSKSDQKLIQDTFSADLKAQLEQRIAQSSFETTNQAAILETRLPSTAGRGTRDQALSKAWTGTESTEDATLRMLDDAHKKLRQPARKPVLSGLIAGRPAPNVKVSAAKRLANARDKTSIYTSQQENMSEEERRKFKQELKDRFSPGARPMPTTLQGLTSLANERIEDAIARGQFKNIQRGKGVNIERDYNASSPFLDTTEYFMNKIIQKQDIVPPWIEKQQELLKMARTFRLRLKSDWRRHAARTISSKGGNLEEQIRRAKAFALAEEKHNPRSQTTSESMSAIDPTGMLTTITVEERIAAGVAPDPVADPVEIKVTTTQEIPDSTDQSVNHNVNNYLQENGQAAEPQSTAKAVNHNVNNYLQENAQMAEPQSIDLPAAEQIIETQSILLSTSSLASEHIQSQPQSESQTISATTPIGSSSTSTDSTSPDPPPSLPQPTSSSVAPMAYPFRDPAWERAELSYHTLAIREINDTARSYNLMAPKIAQKPYYNLQRELNRCFAEVAPTLADEILARSRKGPVRVQVSMHKEGSLLEKFQGDGHVAKVRDEPGERGYGFKEFWRDLFGKDEKVV